ncbi:ATP-binding protein [Sphingomonas sp. DT-51]|uniref:GAF domain-containing sensor histidine kinase n=1 Tax=Sphingomonas sp. DT-51 TaxID=3396165 RepID=UPI003F1D39D0
MISETRSASLGELGAVRRRKGAGRRLHRLEERSRDIERIQAINVVPGILDTICRLTGMGFAAVARVTDSKWIACSVLDEIAFGLLPGGELKLETTICHEIRQDAQAVVISDVASDEVYCQHHTPPMYGFRSYISYPIMLPDGSFFGTLCAIDPQPRDLARPEIRNVFSMFAELIGFHLDVADRLRRTEEDLGQEKATGVQREQFIAVLGHDLRNPLASITAGVTMLRVRPEEDRAATILDGMVASVERMNLMVGNLLDFARGRLVGDFVLDLKRTDAAAIIRQIVAELRAAHPERTIKMECSGEAMMVADEQRMGQLVSNLVGNAVTHGSEAEPVRVLCTGSTTDFELRVSNFGRKIPAEVQAALFQPFERGQTPKREGLGLGLYIASAIAEAHGGSLTVSSTDKETCFCFHMPVSELQGDRAATAGLL